MLEKLSDFQYIHKDCKETSAFLKKAVENKRRSIESKERLVEVIDMLIINRINMVEELEFAEKKPEIKITIKENHNAIHSPNNLPIVADLIKFFEGHETQTLQK